MKKFCIHTMGCKSNQFEGAVIAENLINNGMEQTQRLEEADVFVLNSCTVTRKSDNEAFYLLRNAKNKNPGVVNVLTGCIAQIEKEKLLDNDFVDYVAGNDEKLRLYDFLNSGLKCSAGNIAERNNFNETVLCGTAKTRASIKIQDGCDNRCSYCIIPFARGKSRSANAGFILKQVNNFAASGFKEVVFTGIHIGQWGKDIGSEFLDLLKLVETTAVERYRLGSLNPLEISGEMLEFLAGSAKFCPHFHLSLQSACNRTLQSMNRHYRVEDYLEQIEKINEMFNLPFIGSDIITGFAGESEEDFEITRQNLERSGLTQIHTFPYSVREGTVGAQMPGRLSDKVKEQRAKVVRAISARKHEEFIKKNIGAVHEVLIEKRPDKSGSLRGMTRNYLAVVLNSGGEANTLQRVKIAGYENGKIYGGRVE